MVSLMSYVFFFLSSQIYCRFHTVSDCFPNGFCEFSLALSFDETHSLEGKFNFASLSFCENSFINYYRSKNLCNGGSPPTSVTLVNLSTLQRQRCVSSSDRLLS